MDRVKLSSDVNISRIVYGMWRLGDDKNTSPKHVQQKIEACLEQGITTIDQADIYGDYKAEAILGDCLRESPHLRDEVEIVTKCGIIAPIGKYQSRRVKYYDTSSAHINYSVESSLENMGIEHIDLLLIHRPDPFMDHMETGQCLDGLIKSGKVKSVGVSNFKTHDFNLLSSAMKNPLVTNQIEISVTASEAFTNGDIAFLQQENICPMAWSPLGGGSIFHQINAPLMRRVQEIAEENSVDEAAVAVAWLLTHPANIVPVMGTNSLARIKTISTACNVDIDRETWFELYSLAKGQDVA
jgi:predicted oxidoreductase